VKPVINHFIVSIFKLTLNIMKNSKTSWALWLGGLAAGVAAGALIYQNREKLGPQKDKLSKLISEWQKAGEELRKKIKKASMESIERGKSLTMEGIEKGKSLTKEGIERGKSLTKSLADQVN
jgi:hypothetical protein